jgi:hypothetical protein
LGVGAFAAMFAAIVWIERVPAGSALRLSLVVLATGAAVFLVASKRLRLPLRAAPADAVCLGVTASAAATPLLVLAAEAAGGIARGAVLTAAALAVAALWPRRPSSVPDGPAARPVPASVYALALFYAGWSVAGPFRFFSAGSLVKELYTDGFQRFGTIYALAHGLPPQNPFVAELPLRYYWFSLAPMAALWPRVDADLFSVWKTFLTWQAFAFVVALWWIVHDVFRSRTAAFGACLSAFVFPSWEMLAHPRLRELFVEAAAAFHGSYRPLLESLRQQDPDHLVGVLTQYSDQLLMEDFLYLPQNAAALALFVGILWLVARGRPLAAVFLASSFVGTNSFFAIPGGAAAVAAVLVAEGPLAGVLALIFFTAWALLWGSFCAIVPAPPGAMAFLAAAATAGVLVVRRRMRARPPAAPFHAFLRASAALFVLALLLLVAQRPKPVAVALLLNYGPALVLAAVFVFRLLAHPATEERAGEEALVVLFVFGAVFFGCAAVLAAPFWHPLPTWLAGPATLFGDAVNPFNFYHKAGKAVRLTWCVLGGLSLAALWPLLTATRLRRAASCTFALAILPAAAGSSLLRPVTYMRTWVPPEREAAAYLQSHGASLEDVVLLEDVRASQISQLAPVSTFFISSWSNQDRGLTHAVGTWADQYVPRRYAAEVARREALNEAVFTAPDVGAAIERLLPRERIDWVLTRRRYDLGPGFRLVVDRPGGTLYQRARRGGSVSVSPTSKRSL